MERFFKNIQRIRKQRAAHGRQHLSDKYRYAFYVSRLLSVALLALVVWDPIPGLLTNVLHNDAAVAVLLASLTTLTILLLFDLITRVQHGWQELVSKYFFLVLGIILMFGVWFILLQTRTTNSGLHAQYPYAIERDAFYYSAVTYFTIGYGDFVPFGWAKLLSVVEAGIGSIINLIILALAVTRLKHR